MNYKNNKKLKITLKEIQNFQIERAKILQLMGLKKNLEVFYLKFIIKIKFVKDLILSHKLTQNSML